jgi:hypothetical protein
VVAHICNVSTQKAEAGGLGVQGQPGFTHSEPVSKKKKESHSDKRIGLCFCFMVFFPFGKLLYSENLLFARLGTALK